MIFFSNINLSAQFGIKLSSEGPIMNKHHLFLLTIGSLLSVSASQAIADESLYVQPFRAKVFAKPAIASEVLGTVDSGYQFVSIGKDGSWVKLTFKGKTGFIPAAQAAKTPPLGKSSGQSNEPGTKLGARARTSSSSAVVAGMKGLTYEDRARVTKGERSDIEALDSVDALKITADEIKQFNLEGGKQ
jgi:uncharacterized protein YgiM (DUF1202 family)